MLSIPKKKVYGIILASILLSYLLPYSHAFVLGGENSSKISSGLMLKIKDYSAQDTIPVIVTLKRGDADVGIGGTGYVKRRYDLINAVSAEISPDDIKKLENNPDVEKVYYDNVLYPLPVEDSANSLMGANADTIGATYVNNVLNYTGRNVTIAIVDTGIDYTHPDLGGCSQVGPSCKVRGGYDFVNSDADPMDDLGHGTHCAGIAAANGVVKGVAPDASLLAVKVCSTSNCLNSDTMAGIDWAVANGANIISLSLGSSTQPSEGNDPLQMLCDAAVRRGVTIVAAAGNEGPGTGTIADIAASQNVIAVGADDYKGTASAADDTVKSFSSRGPMPWGRLKPEIVAPGVSIYSTVPNGSCLLCDQSGYKSLSGTSMAAPHAAGAAALLLEYNRSLTPAQIKSMLMESADNIAGHPFDTGAGLINVSRAITSRIEASINENPVWEESTPMGMNTTASLKIKNKNPYAINASLTANALSDIKGDNTLSASNLAFPAQITLNAFEEKTIPVNFSAAKNTPAGTYATILKINTENESIRIPVSLTIPLSGEGTIYGSVNDDCSLETQDGCGMEPPNVDQWGDWRFYRLTNYNGTTLSINLTWAAADSDLDLYLFGPDGGLYGVSGQADTSNEYIELSNPVYPEYWAAVYAFSISGSKLEYHIDVSYTSAIKVEPATLQETVNKGEAVLLNFTLTNDGSTQTGLGIYAVAQKSIANKQVSGNIAYTGAGAYIVKWQKSTPGLDLTDAQYMNATLTWGTPANDLNMYFLYKNGTTWQVSGYSSTHRNDLLGIGQEDILGADIKYYLETFSDIGIGVSNPGSSQSYKLNLNFTGERSCDYAQANPALINSLAPAESRTIQVLVNTNSLTAGNTYDFQLIVKKSGEEIARVPIRLSVTGSEQTTTTTTTSTTTTTTTSSSTTTTTTTTSTSTSVNTTTSTTTTNTTTSTTTTTTTSTTTTIETCPLTGDYPPCGAVTLSEVIDLINEWVENNATLNDVIALINAWAQTQ